MRLRDYLCVLFLSVSVLLTGCDIYVPKNTQPTPAPLSMTESVTMTPTFNNDTGQTVIVTVGSEYYMFGQGLNPFKIVVPAGESSVSLPMMTQDCSLKGTLKISFYTGPVMKLEFIKDE
ncbi:MAG: hypothetical protein V4519_04235 [Patescibacteria group bacterium]